MSGERRPARYRFAEFTVNTSTRLLLEGDKEIPLIPRYFDLLVLLLERRNEAVTRDEIFDRVWSDVIVSDGALTQAIRILRRSLSDRAREPRFIRTVSRHGYRFIFEDVVEDASDRASPESTSLEQAISVLKSASPPASAEEEAALRDAAETLLHSGDDFDLSQFGDVARAHLRDARWDVPSGGTVPFLGSAKGLAAARALIGLRWHRSWDLIRRRWLTAVGGGMGAGLVGGFVGALVLLYGPQAKATPSVLIALPLFGAFVGGLGAAGVGAGLSVCEALIRSYRGLGLFVLGGAGGGLVGGLTHFVGRYTIEGLFGRDLSPVAGGFEGLVIGAAVGAGYALATPIPDGGMATPRGSARLRAALIAGTVCAAASVVLAQTGHHLGAMSLDFMAETFPGSQVNVDPLARLLGEDGPGALTRAVISGFEGLLFGFGLIVGLTTRPRRAIPMQR